MANSFKKIAVGTMIAGAAGYLAGILTAPKSGAETRRDIKDAADTKITETERELKKLHTELLELLDEGKSRAGSVRGRAQTELDELLGNATIMKQKAREILSAIHEGDANDKDLQRVMSETSKAVKHLRSYLQK